MQAGELLVVRCFDAQLVDGIQVPLLESFTCGGQ